MGDFLSVYNVELTVTGPVYIGSGQKLPKNSYIYRRGGNRAYVPDIGKLYSFLSQKGKAEEFENYLLYDKRSGLSQWLYNQKIPEKDVKDCIKYSVECGDTAIEKDLLTFVKDPYGNPYVPGSSIKGMLRTVLLANDIISNKIAYDSVKNSIKLNVGRGVKVSKTSLLNRENKMTENAAFRKLQRRGTGEDDAVNDILQGLIVSDSEPLSVSDLTLCQQIEYHVDGEEKPLPIFRECLKPGTKIKATVTIDRNRFKYSMDEILNAVKNFAGNYDDNFVSRFKYADRLSANTVFLGGGCGYGTKTIVYPLFGHDGGVDVAMGIFEKTVPSVHGHRNDRRKGVSPHILKCTHFQGNTLLMGMCRIRISAEKS